MRNIGKIAVLAMALALAFALSACGGNASKSASSSAASSSASASASASTSASSASASSSSTASSSAAASDSKSYVNTYFALNYNLPENWSFKDANALKKMKSPVANAATSNWIEMVAVPENNPDTFLAVAYIEPSDQTKNLTAETFLEQQVEEMQKSLEGSNISYVTEDAEITFKGMKRTLPAAFTTITVDGSEYIVGQTVAEKKGYFLDVIAGGTDKQEVMNAFEGFKATEDTQ